jgi:hypothetical protein
MADMITGWTGSDLVINEFVYDSFVWIVLGCFGISGIEKFSKYTTKDECNKDCDKK